MSTPDQSTQQNRPGTPFQTNVELAILFLGIILAAIGSQVPNEVCSFTGLLLGVLAAGIRLAHAMMEREVTSE